MFGDHLSKTLVWYLENHSLRIRCCDTSSNTYTNTQKEKVEAPPGNPRVLTAVGFKSPANTELIDDRSMKLFFLWIFSTGEGLLLKIVSIEVLLEVEPLLLLLIAADESTL